MRDWKECCSDDIPVLIDTESSPTTVYVRKDVTEHQRKDETTGETRTEYHYLEMTYTKEEYSILCNAENLTRINEVEDAVIELAEIIGGE